MNIDNCAIQAVYMASLDGPSKFQGPPPKTFYNFFFNPDAVYQDGREQHNTKDIWLELIFGIK